MSLSGRVCEVGLERLYRVYTELPEFGKRHELPEIQARVGSSYLALVYQLADVDIGFKPGYELAPDNFYSWLGGVLPAYCGQGIAQLLIRNHYQVDAYTPGDTVSDGKIHFCKQLVEPLAQ